MADPANPYAQYATPQAGPDDSAGAVVGRSLGNLGADYERRTKEATDQLWSDITNPNPAIPGEVQGGKVVMDAVGDALAPVSAGFDWLVGRPVEAASTALSQATGGKTPIVSKETAGDVAQFAVPVGGELAMERKIAKAAEQAGVSVDALKANLTERAKLHAASNDPIKRKAAQTLIKQGGLDTKEAGEKARDLIQEHKDTRAGAPPRLLDVLPKKGQRVVRAAGAKMGDADETLETHRREMRLGTAEEGVQRAEEMSPYAQSVTKRAEDLTTERDKRADTKYAEPNATKIQVDDGLVEALNFPEGPTSIREAANNADRFAIENPAMKERAMELRGLSKYLTDKAAFDHEHAEWQATGGVKGGAPNAAAQKILDDPNVSERYKAQIRTQWGGKAEPEPQPPTPPQVSAGAIDMVRRQLHSQGRAIERGADPNMIKVAGFHKRAEGVDSYLDKVPGLQEARADYHDYSKRIEQLDFKRNIATMRPNEFQEYLSGLSEPQKKELIHTVFEQEAAKFGSSSRGFQSREDVMTTGPNARKNLTALLGKETADQYLRALDLIGQKIDKANFVAPGVGSKTAGVNNDVAEIGAKVTMNLFLGSTHRAVHLLASYLQGDIMRMGSEEARQVAEWAVQEKNVGETIDEIYRAAISKKAPKDWPPEIAHIVEGSAAVNAATPEPDSDQSQQKPDDSANPYAKFAAPSGETKPADDTKPAPGTATADTEGNSVPPPPAPPTGDAPPDSPADSPAGKSDFDSLMQEYAPGYTPTSDAKGADASGPVSGLLDTVRGLEGSGDAAVSPKGAIGRYQITPDTAKTYGGDVGRLKDPVYEKSLATHILTKLNDRYDGDEAAILVAYNAGPGKADRWLQAGKDMSVLPEETRKYLARAGYGDDQSGGQSGGGDQGDYEALLKQYAPGQAA